MGYWTRTFIGSIALALVVAIPAQGASYPDGGSEFAVDAQGWAPSGESCQALGIAAACTATAAHVAGDGNPPGSIAVEMDITANVLNSFSGGATWTSPAFTVPDGQPVTGATFTYDRRFVSSGLIALSPQSDVAVTLLDGAGNPVATVLDDNLTSANSSFGTVGVGLPEGAVDPGGTYRLRIATTTSEATLAVGLVGTEDTHFDNVVLAVDQTADGGGGPGGSGGGGGGGQGGTTPVVSQGVTVTKGFRSDSQINALFGRFDEGTLVGRGPGGSLVPLRHCTIVGTKGADRITGTRGNDVICGLGGNDVIKGAGGVDIIDGANGKDRLAGGAARDKLIGLRGADRLNGNGGNDRIGGGAGRDRLNGAGGRDRIKARDRTRDRVNGGKGRDRAKVDRLARGARRTRAARRRADRVVRVERVS